MSSFFERLDQRRKTLTSRPARYDPAPKFPVHELPFAPLTANILCLGNPIFCSQNSMLPLPPCFLRLNSVSTPGWTCTTSVRSAGSTFLPPTSTGKFDPRTRLSSTRRSSLPRSRPTKPGRSRFPLLLSYPSPTAPLPTLSRPTCHRMHPDGLLIVAGTPFPRRYARRLLPRHNFLHGLGVRRTVPLSPKPLPLPPPPTRWTRPRPLQGPRHGQRQPGTETALVTCIPHLV